MKNSGACQVGKGITVSVEEADDGSQVLSVFMNRTFMSEIFDNHSHGFSMRIASAAQVAATIKAKADQQAAVLAAVEKLKAEAAAREAAVKPALASVPAEPVPSEAPDIK